MTRSDLLKAIDKIRDHLTGLEAAVIGNHEAKLYCYDRQPGGTCPVFALSDPHSISKFKEWDWGTEIVGTVPPVR